MAQAWQDQLASGPAQYGKCQGDDLMGYGNGKGDGEMGKGKGKGKGKEKVVGGGGGGGRLWRHRPPPWGLGRAGWGGGTCEGRCEALLPRG